MLKNLKLTIDELMTYKFEENMNILNYAIDQESHVILFYLASILKTIPTEKKKLVEHKFGKNQL